MLKPFHDSEHYMSLGDAKLPSLHSEAERAVYLGLARSVEILDGFVSLFLDLLMTITAGLFEM